MAHGRANLENIMQTQCWFCPHCYAENVFEHSDNCPNKPSEEKLAEYLAAKEKLEKSNER